MTTISLGLPIPACTFQSTHPQIGSLVDLRGQNIVLYFYPKDNTPGCTQESKDFAALYPDFKALNTQIIGISRDTLTCHQKFCDKLQLPFPLISDPDESFCRLFNVVIEKNMFKRIVFGIERSTFLIDTKGVLRLEWRKVKVKGHALEVLEAVKKLA